MKTFIENLFSKNTLKSLLVGFAIAMLTSLFIDDFFTPFFVGWLVGVTLKTFVESLD